MTSPAKTIRAAVTTAVTPPVQPALPAAVGGHHLIPNTPRGKENAVQRNFRRALPARRFGDGIRSFPSHHSPVGTGHPLLGRTDQHPQTSRQVRLDCRGKHDQGSSPAGDGDDPHNGRPGELSRPQSSSSPPAAWRPQQVPMPPRDFDTINHRGTRGRCGFSRRGIGPTAAGWSLWWPLKPYWARGQTRDGVVNTLGRPTLAG